jgi:hypothetical protein
MLKTISLKAYPWNVLQTDHACDINTKGDLELARIKAGL